MNIESYSKRFLDVVEIIKKRNSSIYKDLNIDRTLKSKIKSGVQNASIEKILNLCSMYNDVSGDYILTGKGSPLLGDKNLSDLRQGMIPLYKNEAAAGFGLPGFVVNDKDIEGYYLIKEFFNASFMLHVRGHSMEPIYNPGDIIAVRVINESQFIQWNKPHLLYTKSQGLIIKRLKPLDESNILAVSENPEYDPFPVPKEDIDGIALVLGVVRVDNL